MFFSLKRVQKGKSLDDWQEPLQIGEMVWIGRDNKDAGQRFHSKSYILFSSSSYITLIFSPYIKEFVFSLFLGIHCYSP